MTPEKVREVIDIYKKKLRKFGTNKKQYPEDWFIDNGMGVFAHCRWMLDEIEIFIKERRMDKVFRWLGFIQGCLWSCSVYTLNELKEHNRKHDCSIKDFEIGLEEFSIGTRVEIRVKKVKWLKGTVVETPYKNERGIEIICDKKWHNNLEFYNGHGATVPVYMVTRKSILSNIRKLEK